MIRGVYEFAILSVNNTSMKKTKSSLGHAFNGIAQAIKTERNFKIHCLCMIFVVLVGLVLEWDWVRWALAILAIMAVLGAEMINTAIEYTWNHLEPNHHPVVGVIKDIMAGAVLIVSIGAAVIGALLVYSSLLIR